MSSPSKADIDALFEDPFFAFASLPAELRNIVYSNYYNASLTTITLDTKANFTVPGLLHTDKAIYAETRGYFHTWLASAILDPSVRIEAEISGFEYEAPNKKLCALSEKFAVPKEELVKRTRVTFTGAMDFEKLMEWVDAHVTGPSSTPVFAQSASQTPKISGFSAPHLLTGSVSLVEAVMSNWAARDFMGPAFELERFLKYAAELGFKEGDGEDVEDKVFKIIAEWHFDMIGNVGKPKKGRQFGKANWHRSIRDPDEMAQLVYALNEGVL